MLADISRTTPTAQVAQTAPVATQATQVAAQVAQVAVQAVRVVQMAASPAIPSVYARYVDEKCLNLVDCKKSPNKEFIAFLLNSITARFRSEYPTLGPDFAVTMVMGAQVQIIMLARILCLTALEGGFSNIVYGCIDDLRKHFSIASIEHDAWAWFAGAAGPQEKCSIFLSLAVPNEILEIAEMIVSAENDSAALPGSSIHGVDRGDRAVECILTIAAETISHLVFDFWSASIDLEEKTSIRISSREINGVFRLFNHGRIPARSQFFIELGHFGNNFESIKRNVKAKEAALKPPKATRKKK